MPVSLSLAFSLFGAAAFIAPGWWIARRLGWPHPLISGAALAMAGWFHLVVASDLAGLPITRKTLLPAWLLLTLAGAVAAHRRAPRAPAVHATRFPRAWNRENLPWAIAGLIAAVSLATHAVVDPLSGWDNDFRWNRIAEAAFTRGSLDFYPPVDAAAFEIMAWCDGMPPLPSLLNLWCYLLAGDTAWILTSGRLIGEAFLLLATVGALARRWGGDRAFWPAIGVWSMSAMGLWSVMIGQETGLTAFALAAMLLLLPDRETTTTETSSRAIAAGVAAAVAALSREYGLAFGALGFVALVWQRQPRGVLVRYLIAWGALSVTWYARNVALTGNPFYPVSPGGMLPTSAAYAVNAAAIGDYWSWSGSQFPYARLAVIALVTTGAVVLSGAAALGRHHRLPGVGFAGVTLLAVLGLWVWSVPQTAGGVTYSLRVLGPALAVLAALGGLGWSLVGGSLSRLAAVVAILLAADAAKRAWVLPVQPTLSPLAHTAETWRHNRGWELSMRSDPVWSDLHRRHPEAFFLVDSPASHVSLRLVGARVAMWFSPAADPLFDASIPPAETARLLRAAGFTHVMLSVTDPIANAVYSQSPYLRHLRTEARPVALFESLQLFAIKSLEQP